MKERLKREITIPPRILGWDEEKKEAKKVPHRLGGTVFRSYKAVALRLNIGEETIVEVREGFSKDMMIYVGCGEVKRISETEWSEPRRLMQEY